jgi:hypothetical protein
VFPFPFGGGPATGDVVYKRLQVHDVDIDPALNPGAQYFVEGQFVAQDDAAGGNDANNASYRKINVFANLTIGPTGPTAVGLSAIHAWAAAEPEVALASVDVSGDGRFTVGAHVSDLGGGLYAYEYAVHNQSSHRGARALELALPAGANLSGIGFHDVDYHSGEPFDGTDWPAAAPPGGGLAWATSTHASDPEANALRWGTLYNFRFVADVPPAAGTLVLHLFRPGLAGEPDAVEIASVVPRLCDADGVCEAGESCASCGVDCADQGGGGGCCGDGTCDAGEDGCACLADCGAPPIEELACGDGQDGDCDGLADCADPDCCFDPICGGPDADADGFALCDCDDGDDAVWSPPGPVSDLRLGPHAGGGTLLEWSPPVEPGAAGLTYETLRSINPINFVTSTLCLPDADATDTEVVDAEVPGAGGVFCYLARAVNGCPDGQGPLGRSSANQPRQGTDCSP